MKQRNQKAANYERLKALDVECPESRIGPIFSRKFRNKTVRKKIHRIFDTRKTHLSFWPARRRRQPAASAGATSSRSTAFSWRPSRQTHRDNTSQNSQRASAPRSRPSGRRARGAAPLGSLRPRSGALNYRNNTYHSTVRRGDGGGVCRGRGRRAASPARRLRLPGAAVAWGARPTTGGGAATRPPPRRPSRLYAASAWRVEPRPWARSSLNTCESKNIVVQWLFLIVCVGKLIVRVWFCEFVAWSCMRASVECERLYGWILIIIRIDIFMYKVEK